MKGQTRLIAAILIVGAVSMAGILASGSFSGIGFGNDNCVWEDVDINNQTFSSVSEFENAWKASGSDTSWSFVEEELDFRVDSGTLEYRQCVEQGGGQ